MTDTSVAIIEQPTRQAIAAQDRSAPRRVTGRVKVALDAMVWEGLTRDNAAQAASLSVHGLREALRKPHVKAYYNSQLEVLRTSERARNIHRLIAIRDAADNMPAVQAIDRLERLDEQRAAAAQQAAPGFVIQVLNVMPAVSTQDRQMQAKPLIDHASGAHEPDDTST